DIACDVPNSPAKCRVFTLFNAHTKKQNRSQGMSSVDLLERPRHAIPGNLPADCGREMGNISYLTIVPSRVGLHRAKYFSVKPGGSGLSPNRSSLVRSTF